MMISLQQQLGLPATREAHLDVAMIPLLCEYVVTGIPRTEQWQQNRTTVTALPMARRMHGVYSCRP